MGLHFQFTYWAWLLIVVVLLIFIFAMNYFWQKRTLKKLGHAPTLKLLLNGFSRKRKTVLQLFICLVFILGILAAMDLRKAVSGDGIIRKGVDALIVLDVSKSMLATDVKPNRLLNAKSFIYELLNQSPNERFGFILFAGDAIIQLPITSDHGTLDLFIDDASPEYMPLQGSNIDSAIQRSIEAFDNNQNTYKSVLLISDGEEHNNDALSTARAARDKGIVINTIGVGTKKGGTILDDSTGTDKKDKDGNIIITQLNDNILKEIAAITKGKYIQLSDTQNAITIIKKVFASINEKTSGDTTLMNFAHYYWVFILPMIILLIAELFIPVFRSKK